MRRPPRPSIPRSRGDRANILGVIVHLVASAADAGGSADCFSSSMQDQDQTIAWINCELGRFACREISLSRQFGFRKTALHPRR
jgi:hypothetical protein